MERVLDGLPQGAGVLLVRLRSLGDCVLTTPAIALLKQHRPDLCLGVVVEDRFAGVFTDNPRVDMILPPSLARVARFGADLAVNLHGGGRSLWLTLAARARYRAGYAHLRQQWAYNIHIPRAQEIFGEERTVHTAEHVASAVFHLGVPRSEVPRAELYVNEPPPLAPPYAVIHPAASAPEKAWHAQGFVQVAEFLRCAFGQTPVFIGAANDDLSAFADYERVQGANLETLKALLRDAAVFVGNDSGPAHMAAAFGVPVVALYGASDPVVWAPWRTPAETIVAREGLAAVGADVVIGALERLRAAV